MEEKERTSSPLLSWAPDDDGDPRCYGIQQ